MAVMTIMTITAITRGERVMVMSTAIPTPVPQDLSKEKRFMGLPLRLLRWHLNPTTMNPPFLCPILVDLFFHHPQRSTLFQWVAIIMSPSHVRRDNHAAVKASCSTPALSSVATPRQGKNRALCPNPVAPNLAKLFSPLATGTLPSPSMVEPRSTPLIQLSTQDLLILLLM